MTDTVTFTLSIEVESGRCVQHPFHLGTIESVARQCAVDVYNSRVKHWLPVVSVALMRGGKMVDSYVGFWCKVK